LDCCCLGRGEPANAAEYYTRDRTGTSRTTSDSRRRRYAAFWNTGEPRYAEAALARISSTALSFRPPARFEGRARGIEKLSRCHSDLRAEIEELLVVNDRAVVRYTFIGHFTAPSKI